MITDLEIGRYLGELGSRLCEPGAQFESTLREFSGALRRSLDAALIERQRTMLETAADFSTFAFFQPDENALSRIIADLLDPAGSHGQGKVFLDLLLNHIGHFQLTAVSAVAKVRYQDPASWSPDGGILDITIDFGRFGIGIENKPYAGEQPNQLTRYARHLSARYSGHYCLVYLNGSSSPPQSISEAERRDLEEAGRFRIMSYSQDLTSWMERCRDASRAAKLGWFIDEFIAYICSQFTDAERLML